jgi:hypothetical protein
LIAFSHEAEVGVKWKVKRGGWRASQAMTFGCLWVALKKRMNS